MSIGQTHSVALLGLTGSVVEIEVDISDGIPMYSLLGLPDAALSESGEVMYKQSAKGAAYEDMLQDKFIKPKDSTKQLKGGKL